MRQTVEQLQDLPKAGTEERDEGYFNLLAYLISNAISGEVMAIDNYSEMVPLMPDLEGRLEANKQAFEETKHILLLSKLARRQGIAVERRMVEPQWLAIRKHFSAAVKKQDLAACLIIQDLMTETMAIVLYKILSEEADTDEETRAVTRNILADELEHLDIGINRIANLRAENPIGVDDSLVWAHHRVMPELFSMISTTCHFLCDELGVDCASLKLESIKLDLEAVRIGALEQYIEMLDRAGFAPKVTNPLIASMSVYAGKELSSSSEGGTCCGPAASDTTSAERCC